MVCATNATYKKFFLPRILEQLSNSGIWRVLSYAPR